jgi:anti-sigma regulatory factor (Ser/Thr protein kinase)
MFATAGRGTTPGGRRHGHSPVRWLAALASMPHQNESPAELFPAGQGAAGTVGQVSRDRNRHVNRGQETQTPQVLHLAATARAPGQAREWVAGVLRAAGCPASDAATLVISEMVTNSVTHSRSARPGGQVEIRLVVTAPEAVLLEVLDEGPGPGAQPPAAWQDPDAPAPGPQAASLAEHGRGLPVIRALACGWDSETSPHSTRFRVRLPWRT